MIMASIESGSNGVGCPQIFAPPLIFGGKTQLPPAQLAAAQLTRSDWSGSHGRAQLAKVVVREDDSRTLVVVFHGVPRTFNGKLLKVFSPIFFLRSAAP